MKCGNINDYILMSSVGEGSFSTVISALHKETGLVVAIKIIPKKMLDDEDHGKRVYEEFNIINKMNHPFICQCYDSFEDENNFYIVMELAQNGTLLDYINYKGPLCEKEASIVFGQIISAIKYLHSNCLVAHRDLKAENILFDRFNNARITDFGLSYILDDNEQLMKTSCGSPGYVAPEMIKGEKYTMNADIWSAGIILYAMCTGKLPFDDNNIDRLLYKIMYKEVDIPEKLSKNLSDLLEKMLNKDPLRRITLREIENHPWMKKCKDIINIKNHYTKESLDEFAEKLKIYGYDLDAVKVDIGNASYNAGTTVYKMFKREYEILSTHGLIMKIRMRYAEESKTIKINAKKKGFVYNTYYENKKYPSIITPIVFQANSSRGKTVITDGKIIRLKKNPKKVIQSERISLKRRGNF